MKLEDIKIGETYRIKKALDSNGNYVGCAKVIEIVKINNYDKPLKLIDDCVKCECTYHKGDSISFVWYFEPSELVKESDEK